MGTEEDKKKYEEWLEKRDYYFDHDNDCWLDKKIVSIYSETEDAWLAACEYKNEMERAYLNHLKDWDDEIGRLKKENEKLKEALNKIAHDYERPADMMKLARQALRESNG
jgi:hypothetical protein